MKKMLFGFIAVVMVSVTSFGQDYSKIIADKEFQSYLNELDLMTKNVKDIKKIKEYNSDGKIDQNEFKDLYVAFGYKTQNEFSSFLVSQSQRLTSLEKKYSLSRLSQSQTINLLDEAYISLHFPIATIPSDEGHNCERKHFNCILIATATTVAAQLACGSADLTVVLGLLCHGAAATLCVAMTDNCNLEYEECKNSKN